MVDNLLMRAGSFLGYLTVAMAQGVGGVAGGIVLYAVYVFVVHAFPDLVIPTLTFCHVQFVTTGATTGSTVDTREFLITLRQLLP